MEGGEGPALDGGVGWTHFSVVKPGEGHAFHFRVTNEKLGVARLADSVKQTSFPS